MKLHIIIILILLYLIIKELIVYYKLLTINKVKYKYIIKPIYDKYLSNTDDKILQEGEADYHKMFNIKSQIILNSGIKS